METEQCVKRHLSPIRDAKWVADVTGLSQKQVYALAAEGTIPAFRPSERTVRFREDEVLAYIESTRIRPRPTLKSIETPTTVLDCDDDGRQHFKVEAMLNYG